MTKMFRYFTTLGVIAVALQTSVALAQPANAHSLTPPPVPGNLAVEAGHTLFLAGQAFGTQNYICLPSATGFSWTFFSPQATLFFTQLRPNEVVHQQIVTHFLSPNPDENGTGRATWQSSLDTSAVWARVRLNPDGTNGSSTDPRFVAAGAIPWLLLEAVGTQAGPTGGGVLADTRFIQRLNTFGGVAPSTGCSQAGNVGATALVPYAATYFFYKRSH
ncbi:MAG: DUF3455 domain-containing protein [Bryobacteraceae bacterium]